MVERNVQDVLSAEYIELFSWPAYSPDMSPIEHVYDFVDRRLACDFRTIASTDELWIRIQRI